MPIINYLKLYVLFYCSTLNINIPVSVLAGLIISSGREISGVPIVITDILSIHCTIGMVVALLYKELVRKDEYYFYNNAHISKLHIIISAFVIAVCLLILCQQIISLCNIH